MHWQTAGYSYAFYQRGNLIAEGAFGKAILDTIVNVDMTPYTRIHIASCSKTITAAAILHLMEKDEINLNLKTTIGDIFSNEFSNISSKTKKISIENLLTHTSGYDFGYIRYPYEEAIEYLFSNDPPNTIGNTKYSNINFDLLRFILEYYSGDEFEEYIKKNIFSFIPNNNISFHPSKNDSHVFNYPELESGKMDWPFFDKKEYYTGSYGWYSSASNLAQFGKLLLDTKIISESSLNIMFEKELGIQKVEHPFLGNFYKHDGTWTLTIPNKPWSATQHLLGLRTSIVFFPKEEIIGVLFVNTLLPESIDNVLISLIDYCIPNSEIDYEHHLPYKSEKATFYVRKPIFSDEIRYRINNDSWKMMSAPIQLNKGDKVSFQAYKNGIPSSFLLDREF